MPKYSIKRATEGYVINRPVEVAIYLLNREGGVTAADLAAEAGISRRYATEILLRLWLRGVAVVSRGPRGAHIYTARRGEKQCH